MNIIKTMLSLEGKKCSKRLYEIQECLPKQDEKDLHFHKKQCKKNPDHEYFVPANKLKLKDFPRGYDDLDLFDFTQALADLTVRISLNFTSTDRPEFVPDTKDPYPCYDIRGHPILRTGTGRVLKAITYKDDNGYIKPPCPCPECEGSITPSKDWSLITVQTSKYLVFDSSEASNTECRLWFDDDDDGKSSGENFSGWKLSESDIETDWCWMYCVTHDMKLADKVVKMVCRLNSLWEKIRVKYQVNNHRLTIIVSHPHGCSKQVSFGKWVEKQVIDGVTKYTYTNCTCPGSCGALVYRIGSAWCGHPHSGVCDGRNYSGRHYDLSY